MSDFSLDDLHASADVVWDYGVSEDLSASLDAAANLVENTIGPRNSRKTTYGAHFAGYYAELWAFNVETANRDSALLAQRLRDVAQGVRDLEADAKAEQARINAAREWKARRDARSDFEKTVDAIDFLNLLPGDDAPPKAEPIPQMNKSYSSPVAGERREFSGSGGSQVTSALPDDLRSFIDEEKGATDSIRDKPGELQGKVEDFIAKCKWGSLSAAPVIIGFRKYIASNDLDGIRLGIVADTFEAAGGSGQITTLSNDSITQALAAHGVSAQRERLEIPQVQAIGNPPSTGYSNDPVNTATGNFVENEEDLRCEGANALLGWARSYSSLSSKIGGHGPGWASWDGCVLRFSDKGATWTLMDGREVEFPREGDGFGRAAHDNFWLAVHRSADETGSVGENDYSLKKPSWVVSNNSGARWEFDANGRILLFELTPGATLLFGYDDDRLARINHSRGRSLRVTWDGDRISAVESSDGRRVDYHYDSGRLVEVSGPLGTRRYEWNEQGLISAVIDADGIVEARNTYDDQGRVATQVSPHGRVTRFSYLPGRVTSVSDEDGKRANTWVADQRGRVVGIVDADGNRTSMGYDRWGNQLYATAVDGGTTAREFDEHGRLIQQKIPSGARTLLSYDDNGRLIAFVSVEEQREVTRTSFEYEGDSQQPKTVIDGEGGRTTLRWQDGLLLEVIDPESVRLTFKYDEYGDLIASTDGVGNTTEIIRDAVGRAIETISPSGARTQYTYSTEGLLVSRTDPDGAIWSYEYSAAGRLSAVVDPLGGRIGLEYGEHGEVCAIVDQLSRRIEQQFDDLGNVSSVVLPDGARWQYAHDASSRLTCTIDPSGGIWQRTYDQYGRLNTQVDPTGLVKRTHHSPGKVLIGIGPDQAEFKLDRFGRLNSSAYSDGSRTQVIYDKTGRVVESVDRGGARTRIERDKAGRPIRVVRPSGAVERYNYDQAGRLAGVRNALGFYTALVYDVDSRLIEQIWPTGDKVRVTYDVCGRPVSMRRPGAGTYRWTYDLLGRVTESRDPGSGLRRFTYDAAGQLISATGGNGGVTHWEYDLNGRAVSITDPVGGVTRRTFDAMDRCVSETNPLGASMRAAYDAAGRVIESVDADGNAINIEYSDYGRTATVRANGILSLVRRFDATTRQRTIEDYTTSLGNEPLRHTFSYDLRGNLLHYQRGQSHMHWEYDPDGNRIAFTAPSGATTRYRRNVEGALVAVERDGGKTLTFERDEVGRHTAAIVGETHYEWEYFDGFTSKHAVISKGKDPIQWQIAYSEDGLITRVVTDGENVDYEYDAANQLTGLRSSQGIHTWVYDLAGRIVEENRGDLQWRRAYNAAGQLVRSTNSRDQVITYDYDRSGRRLKEEYSNGEQRRFEWSPFGFLAGVVSTAKGATGATVQRSSAHVDATGYLSNVDGQEIFHDPVTSSVAQVGDNDYIHAGPLTAVDGQWTEPSWRPHRHTTLTNPYDNSGAFHAAVASEDGNIPPTTSANAGFQVGRGGSLYFAGLEWLGARQFDSASRTFISPDPLDPVTGSGWAGNPYAYAGNNPLNLFDPTGLQPVTADQLDEYRKAAAPKWGTALAFAAGIGLAFVPGMQGFAAALITGAVLGGAGSIVDQACSGYPIDWKKVGADSIFGLAGGAFGFGFGKAMSWAAKTPVGQAVTRWTGDQLKKVPILQKVLPFLGSGTDDVSRAGAANADVMSGVQSASKGVRHPDFPDADNLMSDMETPVYFSETATAIGGDKATMDNFAVSQGAEHYHDVFVHGHERTGWPWSRHSKLIFHPAQVAEQIRMNPSYDDGMPLRLVQCYGGKVSEEMQLSCAEILSRELGVEVLATSKPARIDIKTGLLEEQIAPGSRDGIIIG